MKKLTHVLPVLCLLVALVCILATTAHAAETTGSPIETVAITYEEFPQVGSWVEDYQVQGGHPEQYKVTHTVTPSSGTGTFETDIYFDVAVKIEPIAPYQFTEDTVLLINGVPQNIDLSPYKVYYYWRYEIVYGEPIDVIDFPQWPEGLQPGHSGQETQLPMPEDSKYTVSMRWRTYDSNGVPSTLADGKLYWLYYMAEPKEGYYIAGDAAVKIGGVPVESTVQHKKQLVEIKREYAVNVQYLDQLDITYTRPRIGDKQSDFSLQLGEGVTLQFFNIYVNSYGLQRDAFFVEGKTYICTGTLKARTGYAFADTVTLVFNGSTRVQVTPGNRLSMELSHEIEYAQTVDTVRFPDWPETAAPGPGGKTEITSAGDAGYTLHQAWIDMRTGSIVETLEAGEIYTLAYMAEPKPGYIFSENTKATVGGEECEFLAEELYLVTYRTYDLGAKKIDRVDVTLPQLKKGCTPGLVALPTDANYELWELIWAESTTDSFEDALPVEVVSFDTRVYAVPVVCAKAGYTFSEDVKLYFNGVEVEVAYIYAEGPVLEIAGLYGTLTPPATDGWHEEDNTWAYYVGGEKRTNAWIADSIGWCYVDADGLMVKNGWAKDSVGWCYLGNDGYMVKNQWAQDSVGWCYLDANGYLVYNKWIRDSIDWCYVGADGYMCTDEWIADSVGWCYVGADGYMVRNGWAADSAGVCRLDENGYIVYDKWINDGNGWAYVDKNGYVVFGDWVQYKGDWYVLGTDGYMIANAWITYKNDVYRMGNDGAMLTSQWVHDGYGWSYVDKDGKVPFESWVKDSGGTCYIGSGGYMLKNSWITIDGKKYYVDENGHMLRNTTRTFNGTYPLYRKSTYKFDSNGVATYVSPF